MALALLAWLAARLVELARIPTVLRAGTASLHAQGPAAVGGELTAGIGIAQVGAARGRLVHRVVLDGGSVRRYQILAPTEWNFLPDVSLPGAWERGRIPARRLYVARRQC